MGVDDGGSVEGDDGMKAAGNGEHDVTATTDLTVANVDDVYRIVSRRIDADEYDELRRGISERARRG